jgi:hypothetical protein
LPFKVQHTMYSLGWGGGVLAYRLVFPVIYNL